MSGLGMLAAAIGGAAGVVGQQAAGDIEQGRKINLAQEQANIDVQKQARIAEAQAALDLSTANKRAIQARDFSVAPETLAASDTVAQAAGKTQRGVKVAEYGDTTFQGAKKAQEDADAADAAARARRTSVDNAASPEYLSSLKTIALADPRVLSTLALQRAQAAEAYGKAGESGARTGLIGTEVEAKKLANSDAVKISGLYDRADAIVKDPSLTSEERAQQLGVITEQIVLMKSKTGAGTGVDKELDTETVKETRINPDGSTSETTRKQVRKAGNLDAPDQKGPAVGAEVDGFVFKGGDPKDKANWSKKGSSAQRNPAAADDSSTPAAPAKRPTITSAIPQANGGMATMSDGTRRPLTKEQFDMVQKIESGEPTSPRERQLVSDLY
jgi:hypothetical protein